MKPWNRTIIAAAYVHLSYFADPIPESIREHPERAFITSSGAPSRLILFCILLRDVSSDAFLYSMDIMHGPSTVQKRRTVDVYKSGHLYEHKRAIELPR